MVNSINNSLFLDTILKDDEYLFFESCELNFYYEMIKNDESKNDFFLIFSRN